MERQLKRSISLLLLMSAAAASVPLLRPATSAPVHRQSQSIESIFPAEFAGWRIDHSVAPVVPSKDLVDKLEKIYDETIARTYINSTGQHVMLSVAYGSNQTGKLRVHRPESCYTAQGFIVKKLREEDLVVPEGIVPVKRLIATAGSRNEPITYWIRVGDETVTGLVGQRLAQLKRGLTGDVPDGLIFRVSSIGTNSSTAFDLQDRFIIDLLNAVPTNSRYRLTGLGLERSRVGP